MSSNVAGKRVKCPECGEAVRVPTDDGDDQPVAPRRSSGGRKKSGKKSSGEGNPALVMGLLAGGGGAVVVGLLAFVFLRQPNQPLPVPPVDPSAVVQAAPPATTTAPVSNAAAPAAAHSIPMPTAAAHQTVLASPATSAPAVATTNPVGTAPTSASLPTTSAATTTPMPTGTGVAAATTNAAAPVASASASSTPAQKLDFEQLITLVKPAVVRINVVSQGGASVGSGFVVDRDGTVITNYHVITGAKKAEVEFADGTKARALGYRVFNQKKDIAIIKIDMPADKLTIVPLAETPPAEGADVMAFGAPLGLSFTSSKGIITALRKEEEMRDQLGADVGGNWLQTDTPISPGNSGGPLVDRYGRVVGMNTMQLSSGQNLNFAVSAQDIAEELKKAPSEVKEFKPDDLKAYTKSIDRKLAREELGTEKGRKMFAAVEEIFLVNATNTKTVALDASGRIWDRVILKSKSAIEKSKIQLSFGEPAADAAVMLVILELKSSRKGTAGTQELKITAQLICAEPHGKKSESPYCMVWKEEETVGTISLTALLGGTFPRLADEKLASLFSKFRTAYTKAVREQKEADEKAKSGGGDKDKAASPESKKDETKKDGVK
ncbi:MAG: trypsin-like peptidase domain-containing protein [Planctomycetota bacterium]